MPVDQDEQIQVVNSMSMLPSVDKEQCCAFIVGFSTPMCPFFVLTAL